MINGGAPQQTARSLLRLMVFSNVNDTALKKNEQNAFLGFTFSGK